MLDRKTIQTRSRPFLYLVTDRRNKNSESFLQAISLAVEGGVELVQLREKNTSFEEFCEIGMRLKPLLSSRGVPLIINDRIDVAKAIQADGVHLGQSDQSVEAARASLGPQALIGLSLDKVEDINRASQHDLDYVAASPLFTSHTKKDCGPPFGLEALKKLCILSKFPVVAIGGIKEENIQQAVKCGLKGVAVISAILDSACPKSAAKCLIEQILKE